MSKKLRFVRDVYAPRSGSDRETEKRPDAPPLFGESMSITKALDDLKKYISKEVLELVQILKREPDAKRIEEEIFGGFVLPEGNAEGRIPKNTVDKAKREINKCISDWLVAQKK